MKPSSFPHDRELELCQVANDGLLASLLPVDKLGQIWSFVLHVPYSPCKLVMLFSEVHIRVAAFKDARRKLVITTTSTIRNGCEETLYSWRERTMNFDICRPYAATTDVLKWEAIGPEIDRLVDYHERCLP